MPDGNRVHAKIINHLAKQPTFLFIPAPQPESLNADSLQNEMAKRGLQLKFASTAPYDDVENLIGIAIRSTASERSLECAFLVARWSQQLRAAKQTHLPFTIIDCSSDVPAPVKADFLHYGHVVSDATPQQIVDLVDVLLVDARRRSRRGITFIFRHKLDPLMTNAGREEELPARGRLLSLLIALCQERREFSSAELAGILNCNIDQVKVRVDRLRRLIATTGRRLGISIGKHEVIQNSGMKGGYFTHACVTGRFPAQL
jgi:hypothetical protein